MNKWSVLLSVFFINNFSSVTNNFAQAQQQLPGVVITADAPYVDFDVCSIIPQICYGQTGGGGGASSPMGDPGGGGSVSPNAGGGNYQLTPLDFQNLGMDPGLVEALRAILKSLFQKAGLGIDLFTEDGIVILHNIGSVLNKIYSDPDAIRAHHAAQLETQFHNGQESEVVIGKKLTLSFNGVTVNIIVWVKALTWQLTSVTFGIVGDQTGAAVHLGQNWLWAIGLYHRNNGGILPPQ